MPILLHGLGEALLHRESDGNHKGRFLSTVPGTSPHKSRIVLIVNLVLGLVVPRSTGNPETFAGIVSHAQVPSNIRKHIVSDCSGPTIYSGTG